ncbi:MAG: hypothetical protein SFW67_12670 [Myxococcaceae bacterium]|nr:hypothetical protein [Myxococcaceae bacterium]
MRENVTDTEAPTSRASVATSTSHSRSCAFDGQCPQRFARLG